MLNLLQLNQSVLQRFERISFLLPIKIDYDVLINNVDTVFEFPSAFCCQFKETLNKVFTNTEAFRLQTFNSPMIYDINIDSGSNENRIPIGFEQNVPVSACLRSREMAPLWKESFGDYEKRDDFGPSHFEDTFHITSVCTLNAKTRFVQ